jgi:hypothetical protein
MSILFFFEDRFKWQNLAAQMQNVAMFRDEGTNARLIIDVRTGLGLTLYPDYALTLSSSSVIFSRTR